MDEDRTAGTSEATAAYVYRLPDGSDDTPDNRGRHTKTLNVAHSAAQAKRFPGCEICTSIAESDAILKEVTSHHPIDGSEPWYSITGSEEQFASMGDAMDAVRQRNAGRAATAAAAQDQQTPAEIPGPATATSTTRDHAPGPAPAGLPRPARAGTDSPAADPELLSDMDDHQREEHLRTAYRTADQERRAVDEAAQPPPEDPDAAYQRALDAARGTR